MELQNYRQIITKYIYLPIFLALIFGILSYNDLRKLPVLYSGSMSFTAGNSANTQNNSFNYDHYYNLASSSSLSETILGWLSSPSIVAKIYSQAGQGLPTDKVSGLIKLMKANKPSQLSSVIIVSTTNNQASQSQAIMDATASVIKSEFKKNQDQKIIPADLNISITEPVILAQKRSIYLTIIPAIIGGLILGLMISIFIGSIKYKNS